jgi:hypothetical protein
VGREGFILFYFNFFFFFLWLCNRLLCVSFLVGGRVGSGEKRLICLVFFLFLGCRPPSMQRTPRLMSRGIKNIVYYGAKARHPPVCMFKPKKKPPPAPTTVQIALYTYPKTPLVSSTLKKDPYEPVEKEEKKKKASPPFLAPWKKNLTTNTCNAAINTIRRTSTTEKLKIRASVLRTVLKFRFSLVRKYFWKREIVESWPESLKIDSSRNEVCSGGVPCLEGRRACGSFSTLGLLYGSERNSSPFIQMGAFVYEQRFQNPQSSPQKYSSRCQSKTDNSRLRSR